MVAASVFNFFKALELEYLFRCFCLFLLKSENKTNCVEMNKISQLNFLWILAIFVLICNSCGFNNANDNPEQSRYTEIIQPGYERLLDTLNRFVDQQKVNGGVALVFAGDSIVFHKGFGSHHIHEKEPFQTTDIFRLASMTKPVTSVAAMMLYEEGKFKLDDPIEMYLPEFKNPQILVSVNTKDSTFTSREAKERITVRHLFTYTSGLYYGFDNDTLSYLFAKNSISEGFEQRSVTLEMNIKALARLPLLHEPGERYHYGMEMDVLGRLIEVWSGMPLDQFFQERIFNPLGMTDTYFYLPEEKHDRLVPVYQNTDHVLAPTSYEMVHYPIQGSQTYFSGGADLSGTAHDYYLFCSMILEKGTFSGNRLLLPETVELMTRTHLETGDSDMGLGFGVLSAKSESTPARGIGSYTWGGFFSTTFWVDPESELIAVLLLQMYPFEPWEVQTQFENLIYDCFHDSVGQPGEVYK